MCCCCCAVVAFVWRVCLFCVCVFDVLVCSLGCVNAFVGGVYLFWFGGGGGVGFGLHV